MSSRDLHAGVFDEGTIVKLEIFEQYAQTWIPTFVMQPRFKEIHIFDFFSGPGYDSNNVAGSPIRILKKIKEQIANILKQNTKIVLHFNEFEPQKKNQKKFESLKINCEEFRSKHLQFKSFLTINYYNKSCEELFFGLLPQIKKYPSLIYLDQNGVKFIAGVYLLELEKLARADFLYFVSSSYFKRFAKTDEFKQILEVDIANLKQVDNRDMHRWLLEQVKLKLPKNTELKLSPFSIKKNSNVYGIIFGAKNYAAVDKFLSIAWKQNGINGEANFDIDDDEPGKQMRIFGNNKTKLECFGENVKELVLNGKLTNNEMVLKYTYSCGHIPKHAADVIKELKKEGKISYESKFPLLTYDNVFKHKKIQEYKLLS
ncbi:MAG: three-Cys-motif partner protein TcmP [bacterium]